MVNVTRTPSSLDVGFLFLNVELVKLFYNAVGASECMVLVQYRTNLVFSFNKTFIICSSYLLKYWLILPLTMSDHCKIKNN